MGFFQRLMFWKKDDIPDLSKLGTLGVEPRASLGQMPGEMPGDAGRPQFSYPNAPELVPATESFSRQGMPYPSSDSSYILAKDIEILSSKLDALRAGIESINQRLANLERIAGAENQQRKYQW